jgi:hypothetical protein
MLHDLPTWLRRNSLLSAPLCVLVVEFECIPAPVFCTVKGDVRIAEESSNVVAIVGIDADAHACRDVEFFPGNDARIPQGDQDLPYDFS